MMILTACIGMFLALVCIDMGMKQYIEDTFRENEERETVVPGLIFRKVYNKGFALNALDQYPKIIKWSSIAAGVGIFLYDLWLLLQENKRLRKLGMIFVTAGALSNIYDRLIRKKVIDYIGIRCRNKFLSNLTANLADIYIVTGMLLVAVSRAFHKNRKTKN